MHRLFAFFVVLSVASVSSLRADYGVMEVTPQSIEEIDGLKVEAVAGEKGTIAFTVTRKATETPPYRSGRLELFDATGAATVVDFAPDARESRVEFRFRIAPGHLETAEFTLIETAHLGGDMYRFRLKEFAPGKVETNADAVKK